MDKGMKKVINLVTNYMSALCETGRVPGRVNRNIEAGLEYYRRETRPATEAEEKEAVTYLRQRNYTHFKLSKRCALKR